ncbi:MAG: 2Fe-2S iron-sulfur cluster binding domain-containing protein [Proteobacteria bacterium]|nr:MAG: 2Fe-2S iron-sulfur cluster binding domain-containing protein [Pseudomonadota bacterium]
MLKMTINGVEVQVKEGTSIIEAYSQNGMSIAHYCWHPGLSVAGVCRLCMVEIEGNPRLQIACNTQVTDGMKVNNESEKVKDAVKWGLDFHLINHPLDCPICDQAGECGLQDQYMAFGKYTPEMAEKKVKKHKVVDLGPRVVLDSERCILCSRCVRFTDEVSKTNELGIFNRGDRAEIGTFPGKPLDNNYSLNTVDICPVGALTSKDFRFRQRVWLLKEHNSICTGCSTGCNTKVFDSFDSFDGLLSRGDKNPNTRGLLAEMGKHGFSAQWRELAEGLTNGTIKTVVVAGPENQAVFPDLKAKIMELSKASKLVWLQAGKNDQLEALTGDVTLIPLKSYVEKTGTYVNYAGIAQTVHRGLTVVPNALSLVEVVALMKGQEVSRTEAHDVIGMGRVHNEFTTVRGSL